tara:strand:- start:182 stop:1138 length:957 start_codon:yes stop_codon:yes gene_type:complete
MKVIAAVLFCLILPGRLAADEIPVRAFGVILSHDEPDLEDVGRLRFRGGLDLRSGASRFGGLSGLDISADGTRLTAIGDRAVWFSARLGYDDDGRLAGISDTRLLPVRGPDGRPLAGRKLTDSESIARLTDGSMVVGFEQFHRLRRFTGIGAPAQRLGAPPALGASPRNGGAESVTRLWGNQLLVLSERLETQPGIAAGWIGAGQDWRPVGFRRQGIFRPVGAATRDDDGAVFILERRFTAIGGIASRISFLPGGKIFPGGVFEGTELGELSAPLVADNFEGIAVRRAKSGETLIYIVSDDNFHDLQRTLLLMFSLAE